jgi:dihydroorotate dehydrogenase
MLISLNTFIYKHIEKPIFFLFDAERVHNFVTTIGEIIGKSSKLNGFLGRFFSPKSPKLMQNIVGITFRSPIGLAAGFDYEAKAVKVLPSIGFGFNTVGTITNLPYGGNPRPRLGRLPESKSLMVNKGFKNQGANWTAEKLKNQKFKAPLGISIGKTNTLKIKTQKEAVEDILQAFTTFEKSGVNNAYYELNISCPNLYWDISFYPPNNLDELLTEMDKLKIKKPIFIKMPINETNQAVRKMLDVISRHKIKGVIFGNLQKDRTNPYLVKEEIKWKVGNFSGLPTQKRSDELISLAFKYYGKKLIIIGCGGVFSAEDAYRKIKLGASLVQLITGLIYEGPLLVADINRKLPVLLKNDGFKNISEAVGVENKID